MLLRIPRPFWVWSGSDPTCPVGAANVRLFYFSQRQAHRAQVDTFKVDIIANRPDVAVSRNWPPDPAQPPRCAVEDPFPESHLLYPYSTHIAGNVHNSASYSVPKVLLTTTSSSYVHVTVSSDLFGKRLLGMNKSINEFVGK